MTVDKKNIEYAQAITQVNKPYLAFENHMKILNSNRHLSNSANPFQKTSNSSCPGKDNILKNAQHDKM